MLKKRIIATLIVRDGILVQSLNFNRYLPVGNPAIAIEFFDDWGVDEIILLDISASRGGRSPDFAMVQNVSARCHVPLTVGGGINSIEHVLELMHCGADKVSFNQIALHQPTFIEKVARLFGTQCVVASIDAVHVDGSYRVYDYLKRKVLEVSVAEFARQIQAYGAGEILINSVDFDGAQCGYNINLINTVCAAVTVPVICCGGAGKPQHFIEVLESTQASAVAAANFFHFTEHSVTITKALVSRHIPLRHETHASYQENSFNSKGRLLKKNDAMLEELLYCRIKKEII